MDYERSERYQSAVRAFLAAASEDPQLVYDGPQAKITKTTAATTTTSDKQQQSDARNEDKVPYSLVYHRTLVHYLHELHPNPSEACSLAGYCQHIRRWQVPRSSYPEGLAGYRQWRTALYRFHTEQAHSILEQSGYSKEDGGEDAGIFERVADLLCKRTLRGGNDRGEEEMQVFEDAICLTFLALEFAEFSRKHDEEKMVRIVQKTWNKMGQKGRAYASEFLATSLPEDARVILTKSLPSPSPSN